MVLGDWHDLYKPNSIIIDKAGYLMLFPDQPLELGRVLELNDHRVTLVGISDAMPAFVSFPIVHARYSEALAFQGRQRQQLSFVLVRAKPGIDHDTLAARITSETGLKALTTDQFRAASMRYYLANTGIPVNFGITIAVATIVGLVVSGQTFYLFTVENLRQFGALKAIGVTNGRLTGMVLLQAATVGVLGFALGTGLAAVFFQATLNALATRGIVLLWQSVALTGACILAVILAASLLSIRRVVTLEPATVFR
jgi:putative ABC transport system permease protein